MAEKELDPSQEFAEAVWAQLADKSESYRSSFIDQLREHMCTNCGGDGSWCCYDSRPDRD